MGSDSMAGARSGDEDGDSLREGFLVVIGRTPVVGPYLQEFGRLSTNARRTVIAALIVLLAYPVFSFFVVLLLLRFSPHVVQASARDFIVTSIGVGDQMDRALNLNNKAIDAELPMTFGQDGKDSYRQTVSVGQTVTLDGLIQTFPLAQQKGNCGIVSLDDDRPVGTIDVASADSSYQSHSVVRAHTEDDHPIAQLGQADWVQFLKGQHTPSDRFPLRISFKPAADLKDDPYFDCYGFRVVTNFTIYKPVVGIGGANG